jgi:hypothetical protein
MPQATNDVVAKTVRSFAGRFCSRSMSERFCSANGDLLRSSPKVVKNGTFEDAQPQPDGLVGFSSESKNLNGHDLILESFHSVRSEPEFKAQIRLTKATTGNITSRFAKTSTLDSSIYGFVDLSWFTGKLNCPLLG